MSHSHSHPHAHPHPVVSGFGADRAPHYDAQAAVVLAGHAGMYEVAASALASQLEGQESASLLSVGLGTGQDLMPFTRLGVPGWRFTGVDPSPAMLDVARQRLEAEGLMARTHLHVGELHTLPEGPQFDGGVMIGVVHHVEGEEARLALLREAARRLKPGAPFVVGCRIGPDPVLSEVELKRWSMYGMTREELEARRQGLRATHPPESDAALCALLARAGLVSPRQLFVSIQFKVWLARLEPQR